jgi:hypothetical protein
MVARFCGAAQLQRSERRRPSGLVRGTPAATRRIVETLRGGGQLGESGAGEGTAQQRTLLRQGPAVASKPFCTEFPTILWFQTLIWRNSGNMSI